MICEIALCAFWSCKLWRALLPIWFNSIASVVTSSGCCVHTILSRVKYFTVLPKLILLKNNFSQNLIQVSWSSPVWQWRSPWSMTRNTKVISTHWERPEPRLLHRWWWGKLIASGQQIIRKWSTHACEHKWILEMVLAVQQCWYG